MAAQQFKLDFPSSWISMFLALIMHFLVTEVTSKSYYHSDLVLDFLCTSRTIPIFVRDVPWDCTSYVVCMSGRAVHSHCPGDKVMGGSEHGMKCLPLSQVNSNRCRGQILKYLSAICRANPAARIPSKDSCSHYVECSAVSGPDGGDAQAALTSSSTTSAGVSESGGHHLLECPYPQLFSTATGDCRHHGLVACRDRFEPKAPCDYVQYLQLYNCADGSCHSECSLHHPSCLALSDGFHPVPHRPDAMLECRDQRTADIVTCPPRFNFSAASALCVRTY